MQKRHTKVLVFGIKVENSTSFRSENPGLSSNKVKSQNVSHPSLIICQSGVIKIHHGVAVIVCVVVVGLWPWQGYSRIWQSFCSRSHDAPLTSQLNMT